MKRQYGTDVTLYNNNNNNNNVPTYTSACTAIGRTARGMPVNVNLQRPYSLHTHIHTRTLLTLISPEGPNRNINCVDSITYKRYTTQQSTPTRLFDRE